MQAREVVAGAVSEVAPDVDVKTLDPDRSLQEAGDLDSLDFLRVLELIEERSGVPMPDSDAGLRTFRGLVARLTGNTLQGSSS